MKVDFKIANARIYLKSVFLFPALIAHIYKFLFESLTARNLVFVFERKASRPLVGHPALEAGTLGEKKTYLRSHRALIKSQR